MFVLSRTFADPAYRPVNGMTIRRRQALSRQVAFRTMSLAFDAERQGRRTPLPQAPDNAFGRRFSAPGIAPEGRRFPPGGTSAGRPKASEARADRRRTARRDEQAVAAWLRELSARSR
jgi:hypothetical protein